MPLDVEDTIVAIASAPGGALRGIVRMSGPDTVSCLTARFDSLDAIDPVRRRQPTAFSGSLSLDPPFSEVEAQVLLWPTSRSYTRQSCAEIHTLGCGPLLEAVVNGLCASGARVAEPGEFTMRAFLAGRIDLTQAEAVLGVIDARDRSHLDVALAQLAGGLASGLDRLRSELLDLLAHLEAGLDFVEEDIEFISPQQLANDLASIAADMKQIVAQMSQRGSIAGTVRVALVGWPNVGKSSLMNALAKDTVSIVSETAGTTRDYVSRHVYLDGLDCLLVDTAGVAHPPSSDQVGSAAQAMTNEQIEQADLQLLCLDATRQLNPWERLQLARNDPPNRLVVLTKTDQPRQADVPPQATLTSSRTGAGIRALRQEITQAVLELETAQGSFVTSTSLRCRESLNGAWESIVRARQCAENQLGDELIATELRSALDQLGRVVGTVYTDDVLDRIFSRFCIGK